MVSILPKCHLNQFLTKAQAALRTGRRRRGKLGSAGRTGGLCGTRVKGGMDMAEVMAVESGAVLEIMGKDHHGVLNIGLPDLQGEFRAAAAA